MTEKEKEQFGELYRYVKTEVMNYDSKQSLPSSFVLGLKGLATGKVVENKRQKDRANYGYDIVLLAFKLSKNKISYAIRTKDFKSEQQKFHYIRKIVEDELNNAYLLNKRYEEEKSKVDQINISNLANNQNANYIKKTTKVNDKLKNLW
ncbi:hypothetical protein [Faecalibacillus intestinalis]|uniref:hypothetical protein n=1 Tax=Faecalibacillus intestinalis TaxID=1982626 RepID=UPI003521DC8F